MPSLMTGPSRHYCTA
uniref:Uncharacterized protein n=1 Tax=Anguilla anguilla TaxID=7936 RepID=A0A0E9TI39_ANGAN